MKINPIKLNINFQKKKKINPTVTFKPVEKLLSRDEINKSYQDIMLERFQKKDSSQKEIIKEAFIKYAKLYYKYEYRYEFEKSFSECFDKKTGKFNREKFEKLFELAKKLTKNNSKAWNDNTDMTSKEIDEYINVIIQDFCTVENWNEIKIENFITEEELKYDLLDTITASLYKNRK